MCTGWQLEMDNIHVHTHAHTQSPVEYPQSVDGFIAFLEDPQTFVLYESVLIPFTMI